MMETEETNEPKRVETCPSFRNASLPLKPDVLRLRRLTAAHIDSFDYFLDGGLAKGIKDIEPSELTILDPKKTYGKNIDELDLSDATTYNFWFENVTIAKPSKPTKNGIGDLYPRECRERRMMYAGALKGVFCYQKVDTRNGLKFPGKIVRMPKEFGNMPIMVMSKMCHLRGTTAKKLVKLKEEENEMGGYFVVNGIERCVRLLQVPRRNFPTAVERSNYKKRGSTYTEIGVAMRCARHNDDMTSVTNTVHYLTTGGITLRFTARKQEFLIPVILLLRGLSTEPKTSSAGKVGVVSATKEGAVSITDEEIYRRIVQGNEENTFLVARARLLLQDARARFSNLDTSDECLAYIGSRFRLLGQRAETTSDVDAGHFVIRRYIQIHALAYEDKLESLFLMIRKLYSFAAGDCGVDNADSLQNQEILTPGHLLCAYVKEKFEDVLQAIRLAIIVDMRKDFDKVVKKLPDSTTWSKLVDRFSMKSSGGIGKKIGSFLSTGNLVSSSGLDLMQASGYTIVAEKLNFLRFCSHFRAVHRGQFFMEMKTTSVRKLLPDQWGFLCPVHTPDGGPCGLLSHLAMKASVLSDPAQSEKKDAPSLQQILISMGVTPSGVGSRGLGGGRSVSTYLHLPVVVDGLVLGGASATLCKRIASHLRELKVQQPAPVPPSLEVALIPPGRKGSPYPGLYLFTKAARLVRPVLHRATGKTELIGPLEQGFMDIACLSDDVHEGITTHQELDPTNMLSLIANLTPFSDQNQSPRNMYQCQMGKQTMGTPAHSLPYRTDNKLYRLQTPQAPLVQTAIHGEYKMDEYPNGTNAVIAVMSYTGFDMEDAMIINKASYDRGFAYASVYKTMLVNLEEETKHAGGGDARLRFSNKGKKTTYTQLDDDGLPKVGDCLREGDLIYCLVDSVTGDDKTKKHKDKEVAFVQSVTKLGFDNSTKGEKVSITLRYPRNPIIGDKFSSRHGQKGVLSITWPQEDMPFSESGITPDILFNPHGFPSRMTIGMLVEMMAAKSGSLHGHYQNGTPFTFHESGDKVSVDYFGEQLLAAGYNYYGSEPLYSGVSGCVMHADLYIGVVYYQRLRHMVSDKYQVRATGPMNSLTRQPVKGRKKGGGIRLGEMERDSLLSHGTAFLLHDRLLHCSDKHIAYACSRCGDLLSTTTSRLVLQTTGQSSSQAISKPKVRLFCRNVICENAAKRNDADDEAVEPIVLPYVYRYLANELAGMNMKMRLEIK